MTHSLIRRQTAPALGPSQGGMRRNYSFINYSFMRRLEYEHVEHVEYYRMLC